MTKTKIFYWITTGLFSVFMFSAAIPDILSAKDAVEAFNKMNMPVYLLPFLGIAKALGVLGILIPRNQKIKEWAYAGLFFDLIGASYCMAAAGLPASNWGFMVVPLILAAASYKLYLKKLSVVSSDTIRMASNAIRDTDREIRNKVLA